MVLVWADALHVHALAGVLLRHSLEERDERLLAVGDVGIVLDVDVADVPAAGLRRPALVEQEVVEAIALCLLRSS
jgi:hypothetical protein